MQEAIARPIIIGIIDVFYDDAQKFSIPYQYQVEESVVEPKIL